ncbi:hypothetical protein GGS23DRAFT_561866 [Durotheca rogersii]|uniref:uncharacterized protein n=1 Tax=Durotheca rogersii TaxID=419775 RepID=UPI00221E43D5|nr:uncharacterized protein GGS23DRAFT_561866 [Durotheca rogersii]KAI5864802.1 hypothetical protein GGS23DRAFT_561866 [Durotheca rogersii]
MAYLELFALTWSLYPRRVLIYLHEKGLLPSPHIKVTPVTNVFGTRKMVAPGKPPGTVPILVLPDGSLIKQSIAILEYFEELCDNPQEDWQKEIAATAKRSSMMGRDARARATTREVLQLADEATSFFTFACRTGTKLAERMGPTNAVAARMTMEYVWQAMRLLEAYYEGADARVAGSDSDETATAITIADCVLFSLLQFSKGLYGRDIVAEIELPNLRKFYDAFSQRESAKIPADFYPRELTEVAQVWLE